MLTWEHQLKIGSEANQTLNRRIVQAIYRK